MNRFKQEELKKRHKAGDGFSKDERVQKLAKTIHAERFPEEYDFMYDSNCDAKRRNRGINPMSQEYIDEVKKKRAELGVSPLSGNGMPTSDDTFLMCLEEAKATLS